MLTEFLNKTIRKGVVYSCVIFALNMCISCDGTEKEDRVTKTEGYQLITESDKSNNPEGIDYSIRDFEFYVNGEVYSIQYAVVDNLDDLELQWKINQTLFDHACWIFKCADMNEYLYKIYQNDVKIKAVHKYRDFLSVVYSGKYRPATEGLDGRCAYSIVVNLKTGKRILMNDLIISDKFKSYSEEYNDHLLALDKYENPPFLDYDMILEYGQLTEDKAVIRNYTSVNGMIDGKTGSLFSLDTHASFYMTEDAFVIMPACRYYKEIPVKWEEAESFIDFTRLDEIKDDALASKSYELELSKKYEPDSYEGVTYSARKFYFRSRDKVYCIPYVYVDSMKDEELRWKINRTLTDSAFWMVKCAEIGDPIYDIYNYDMHIADICRYKNFISILYQWGGYYDEITSDWIEAKVSTIVIDISTGKRIMLLDLIRNEQDLQKFLLNEYKTDQNNGIDWSLGYDYWKTYEKRKEGNISDNEIKKILEYGSLTEDEVVILNVNQNTGKIGSALPLSDNVSFLLAEDGVVIFPDIYEKNHIFINWNDARNYISIE